MQVDFLPDRKILPQMARHIFRFFIFLAPLALFSCSWTIRFFITNTSNTKRTVSIEIGKPVGGFVIFESRHFVRYPLSGDTLDYEKAEPVTDKRVAQMTIEIPPLTALAIGYLSNDNYTSSKQKFINGRVFNLKAVRAGQITITKENFDEYFKKKEYGYAWELPPE